MTLEERIAARAEKLQNIYDNIVAELERESLNPQPSYELDDQIFSWGEYFEMMMRQLEVIEAAIKRMTRRPTVKWLGRDCDGLSNT